LCLGKSTFLHGSLKLKFLVLNSSLFREAYVRVSYSENLSAKGVIISLAISILYNQILAFLRMDKIIYLDNNATTQIDKRVLEEMMPFLTDNFANASSNHEFGAKVNGHIKDSRAKISHLIGSKESEVILTSGATESINIAIKGVAENYKAKGNHIVTVSTEHPAVLDTCRYLESKGFNITYLPVQSDGLIDLDRVKSSVRNDTILVSTMLVNNETGVIQPIKEISEIAHTKGAFFMTDATQAVGKMKVNVDEMGIDLMAFSGHKFYGPKGVGGLFIRSRKPTKVKPIALIHGGGHELGFRSGTLNVPGIIGLGKAAEIALQEMETVEEKTLLLRDELETELLKLDRTFLNGNKDKRLYNVSNICFENADTDAVMAALKSIMISNGSACTSTKVEPSHVLKALGRTDKEAYSSIRFSLGKFNNKADIDLTIQGISKTVSQLRSMLKATNIY
jgi:cysteine desulfurase